MAVNFSRAIFGQFARHKAGRAIKPGSGFGLPAAFGGKRFSSNINVRFKLRFGSKLGSNRSAHRNMRAQIMRQNRAVLYRAGNLTRVIARNSIRSRKSRAIRGAPGQPPINHMGRGFGLKWIEFDVHPRQWSVVVGSVRIQGTAQHQINTRQTTPNVIEYGGRGMGTFNTPVRRSNGQRIANVQIQRPVVVERRPYIRPAGNVARRRYPQLFRNYLAR